MLEWRHKIMIKKKMCEMMTKLGRSATGFIAGSGIRSSFWSLSASYFNIFNKKSMNMFGAE
jgi:hypothetical protein